MLGDVRHVQKRSLENRPTAREARHARTPSTTLLTVARLIVPLSLSLPCRRHGSPPSRLMLLRRWSSSICCHRAATRSRCASVRGRPAGQAICLPRPQLGANGFEVDRRGDIVIIGDASVGRLIIGGAHDHLPPTSSI
ncbi:hypothetical protein [Bradyrhizobium sp. SZCCHNS3051]|uniref:hypothetical protein n=1 Tax=Bradyrhizobium sp. SZCCHNS3051 TaxID=3057320 RepID=UPI002916D4A8|nr:hypothetical protein [Bradyrhizobium sp. SZCCHNS3051]